MTPIQAGALMRHARAMTQRGRLTPCDFQILDCLVFRCRKPGTDRATVSISRLQRLTNRCRSTIVDAIGRLENASLLRKVKTRVRVAWGGGFASRQGTNYYVFDTELAPSTTFPGGEGRKDLPPKERMKRRVWRTLKILPRPEQRKRNALEDALARLGAKIASRTAADEQDRQAHIARMNRRDGV